MQLMRTPQTVTTTITERSGYFPLLVQLGDGSLRKVNSPIDLPNKPYIVKETNYLAKRKELHIHKGH